MMVLVWLSIIALAYVYLGYPMLLTVIVALRGPRPIARRDITPTVSLVISAYNEAGVIRYKLLNALDIDYPSGRLEIVVISDASDDGTDDLVREFAARGVKLMRQNERRGKTAGLNAVVPHLSGDIVVFSDANAMYQPDAIQKLVRNFADPEVGCVTGEARYTQSARQGAAEIGERAYWDYEIQQKRLETAIGSTVGGDGAIYAIRRQLWQTLPETAINDFLNPLQIVAAGWRGIYEPAAICFEETAGGTRPEYRRRVRIVSRSWRAVFQAPGALNPFRVGLFALSLVSHKLLRWWSGLFISIIVVGLAIQLPWLWSAFPVNVRSALIVVAPIALLVPLLRRMLSVGLYFLIIQIASLVGIAKGTIGHVSGTWRPPRQGGVPHGVRQLPVWPLIVALGAIVLAADAAAGSRTVVEVVFWTSIALLGYVYVAYPMLIAALSMVRRRHPHTSDISPTVALLIVANDEAEVIDAKLQNSLLIEYPRQRLRIVVASDGSVDRTNDIVSAYAADGIELLALPQRRGKMAAINSALSTITADVVVFSDANVFLQPTAVRKLVANLADPEVGAVSGDVILVGDRAALAWSEDLYYRYERWLQKTETAAGSMVSVDGALYALRRSLFVAQPPDTILDDMAIPMAVLRAGHRVVYEPDALAIEQGSQSAWEEFSRKSRVVAGAAQFLLRGRAQIPFRRPQILFSFFSHKVLRWLSPAMATATLVSSIALAPVSNGYLIATIVQAAVLATGLAGCAPRLRRFPLIGFAHYYWLVQAAASVGFVRGLLGRQPPTWQRFARVPISGPGSGARMESVS
jgi:cellulose synthase/poly-beta-1,6-N-acetylglucosamine synthase-like glycosyltransferase